jgi:pimeloyl-ACP methyl ester carboxylesterase
MIDEQYINGTYFKRYSDASNKHLLFLLTGQSMGPRSFWDFKLPDGKTHSEYFLEAGIDVILFDPIGYGKSTEFYSYDRVGYAKQIIDITKTITKEYTNKAMLGFSTSTSPALIAAESDYFNKLIFHSPAIMRFTDKTLLQTDEVFESNMDKLKDSRIGKISDMIIPKSNRVDGWEESITEVNKTYTSYKNGYWKCPGSVVGDVSNYHILNGNHGFDVKKINAEILTIVGQYDFEMYTVVNLPWFVRTFRPKFVSIPNSTHFSMWENNSHLTRKEIIDFITK